MSSEDITIGIDVEGADEAADAIDNVTKAVTGLNDVNLDNLDNASQSLDAVTSSAQQVVDPLDQAQGKLNDIQLIDLSNLDTASQSLDSVSSSAQSAVDPLDQTKSKLVDLSNINTSSLENTGKSLDAIGEAAQSTIDPIGISRDRMNELGGVSESTSGSFRTFVGSMNNAVTGFSALGVGMLNIISNYTQMERAQTNAQRASDRLNAAKAVEANLQDKVNQMIAAGDTASTKFQQTETALANAHNRVGTQADFARLTQEHANETFARFFTEIVPSGIAIVSGLAQTIATMPQTINNLKSAFDGLSKALGISDALSAIGPAGKTAADGEYAAAGGATALSGSMGRLLIIIPQVVGILGGVYGGLKLQQQTGFDASKSWSEFGKSVGDAAPPLQGILKWLDNTNTQMDILVRQGLEKLGIKLPATAAETQKMNEALGKTSGAASQAGEDLGPLGSIVENTAGGFNILADNTKKANEQTRDVPGAYNAAVGTVQRFGDAAILAGGEILETGNKTESAGQLMTNALKNSTDSWNKDAQAITDWAVAHNTPIDVIGKTGTELHDMSLFLAAVTDQEDKSTKKAVDWLARHGEMNLVMDVGIEKAIAYANAHGAQTEKVNESAKSLEEYTKDLQDATEKQNLQTDALLKSVEQGGSAARAMADLAKSYAEAVDKSGQLNTKLTDSHAIWDRYNTDILDGNNQFDEFILKTQDTKTANDQFLSRLQLTAQAFGGLPDLIAPTIQNYEEFYTANVEGGNAAFDFQQKVTKAWQDITSAGDTFFSAIIKSMGESGQQGSQDFIKAIQDLPPQVQALLTPSDVQSLAVQASFAQAGQQAGQAFAIETQAAIGKGFPSGQAEQIGLQAALRILEGVAQANPQFKRQFDQLWTAITSGQPEQIKAALDNLGKMPGPVGQLADQMGQAMQPAWDIIGKGSDTAVGKLTENLTQMGLHWATTGQDIVNQAGQVVGSIDPVTGAFVAASGGVSQYQAAVRAGQDIWAAFININNQLTYAISQAGAAAHAMNEGFKTGANDAAGYLNSLAHYALTVWVPDMKEAVNTVASVFNTYIKAGIGDAAGHLNSLVDYANKTWLPDMKTPINGVAVALNQYTAQGVRDAEGNFNALVNWAQTVWLPQMKSIIQQGTPPGGTAAGSPTLSGRGTPGAPYAPSYYAGGGTPYYYAQHGFVGIVDKPTAFVVGEAGPEYVSVVPGGGTLGTAMTAGLQDTTTSLLSLQKSATITSHALAGSGLSEAADTTSSGLNQLDAIVKPLVPALDDATTSAKNIVDPINFTSNSLNNLGNAANGAAGSIQNLPQQFAYLLQYMQPGYVPPQFAGLAQYGSFPGPSGTGQMPAGAGGPGAYGPFGAYAQYGQFGGGQPAAGGGAAYYGGPPAGYAARPYGPFGGLAQYGQFGGGGSAGGGAPMGTSPGAGGTGGGSAMWYGGPPQGVWSPSPYGGFGAYQQYGQFGGGQPQAAPGAMYYGGPPSGAYTPSPYGAFGGYSQYGQFGGGQQQQGQGGGAQAQGGPQGDQGGAYTGPQSTPAQYGQGSSPQGGGRILNYGAPQGGGGAFGSYYRYGNFAQHGFEGLVSQATAFIAGEAGPEYVSIKPFAGTRGSADMNTMIEMILELIRQLKNQSINVNVNSYLDGYTVYKNQQKFQNQRYGTYLG